MVFTRPRKITATSTQDTILFSDEEDEVTEVKMETSHHEGRVKITSESEIQTKCILGESDLFL